MLARIKMHQDFGIQFLLFVYHICVSLVSTIRLQMCTVVLMYIVYVKGHLSKLYVVCTASYMTRILVV